MGVTFLLGYLVVIMSGAMNGIPRIVAQVIHDGGTLENRDKYQNVALKFISPFKMKIVALILLQALGNHNPTTNPQLTVKELFALPEVMI